MLHRLASNAYTLATLFTSSRPETLAYDCDTSPALVANLTNTVSCDDGEVVLTRIIRRLKPTHIGATISAQFVELERCCTDQLVHEEGLTVAGTSFRMVCDRVVGYLDAAGDRLEALLSHESGAFTAKSESNADSRTTQDDSARHPRSTISGHLEVDMATLVWQKTCLADDFLACQLANVEQLFTDLKDTAYSRLLQAVDGASNAEAREPEIIFAQILVPAVRARVDWIKCRADRRLERIQTASCQIVQLTNCLAEQEAWLSSAQRRLAEAEEVPPASLSEKEALVQKFTVSQRIIT
ncbi:unnamed protein product [Protopolystoma xenopodis]|uniref:Uncharacterized protein n=1 Tax=Protopolystoma xenopodis TaxID=117903 RepID=A0A448XN65_9PLAT|nr:unnamed protein product [Protopolystoma xenopodis]